MLLADVIRKNILDAEELANRKREEKQRKRGAALKAYALSLSCCLLDRREDLMCANWRDMGNNMLQASIKVLPGELDLAKNMFARVSAMDNTAHINPIIAEKTGFVSAVPRKHFTRGGELTHFVWIVTMTKDDDTTPTGPHTN